MKRRPEDRRAEDAEDHENVVVGAAVRAPLSQGREGSFPVELEGVDLTLPADEDRRDVRGAPTEATTHAPTTTHIEERPVATGETTVEDVRDRRGR